MLKLSKLIHPISHGNARFEALRNIETNEELTVSYIDTSLPFQQRQHYLQWAYGFSCNCSKCEKKGWDKELKIILFNYIQCDNTVNAIIIV